MFLIRQSRRALGIAIALICLFPSLAKGQFFEESAVWEGTDSIGREVVLYISPEGRFYSRYPLLTSATGDGHGVWTIDSADNTIRFRSLSGEVTTFPVDLISRRYTLAKGQEEAVVLTAGDTGHQLTLRPLADSPAFLPEKLIEYSVQVPENVFYDPADPAGSGLNLDSWTPHGVVFSDSTGAEISLAGADRELFRVQRNEAAGHTLVYLAQPLQAKADQSGYELSIVRQPGLAKRPIVAASTERFLIHVNPGDSVVGGLPPIFALPPIFLGPEPDAPLKIRFFGANNYTLSVEDSADLANWKTVGSLDGEGETVEWIDSRNNRPTALYYRIRLAPKELASPGVFDFSGGKPLDPGSKLAQDLAKTVLARLNIDGRYVMGTTVESVVRLLPPIFGPQYLVELRGNNEQQQPVSVYAELAEAGVQKTHFVTKLNVDDRWKMPLRVGAFELDDDLSLVPIASDMARSAESAQLAMADLNERTGKNWSLVEVISSLETGEATDHLVLSLKTPEGDEATAFVEVGMDLETNQSEVLTAFMQSELGITVIPIAPSGLVEIGDGGLVSLIPGSVELNPVKADSPLAKRLAEFLLVQEPAAKAGLKLMRIVAVTQAKTADSSSYFVELLASTEVGATVQIQAHVNELDDGQLGLMSFQMVKGE
jgi:hypothetical protein